MSLDCTCYNQMKAKLENSKVWVIQLLTHLVHLKMRLKSKLLIHAHNKIYTLLIDRSMYDLARSLIS